MEHFYDDEFERYLKEQADQFKLEPSKKAWHGIYNNFHPGRRWPSIATGLMIILLLTFTNNLNTRQQQEMADEAAAKQSVSNSKTNNKIHTARQKSKPADDVAFDNSIVADLLSLEEYNDQPSTSLSLIQAVPGIPVISPANSDQQTAVSSSDKNLNTPKQNIISTDKDKHAAPATSTSSNVLASRGSESAKNEINTDQTDLFKTISTIPAEHSKAVISTAKMNAAFLNANSNLDFKKIFKKLHHKGTWNYYVSPTLNYRIVGAAAVSLPPNNFNSTAVNQPDMSVSINNHTLQHIAPGLEIGSNISFNIARNLQFFTGLQLNYSGFNITASHTHPVVASIRIMKYGVPTDVPAISYYSNEINQTSITLHDYQIEGMIPIGLKFKMFQSNKISFNLLSAFQPSFIVKEQSYLLSTDTRNYVSYPDLQRNLNINSELGAFVSFKAGKLNYSVGPEFRYQLLSNFKGSSPYSEHLVNYGIRFSVGR